MTRITTILGTSLAVLVACSPESPAPASSPVTSDGGETVYESALNHASRSEADRARDAGRKPGEVLKFFGVEPGMEVLDMFSGGGYYTEILSRCRWIGGSCCRSHEQCLCTFRW